MAYYVDTIGSSASKDTARSLGFDVDSFDLKKYILDQYGGSIETLNAKARCGENFKAQACLAGLYECGMPELNIQKDSDKAIYWYETALKSDTYDTTRSLSSLGALYSQKDEVVYQRKGIELFRKAAGFGDKLAEINLAESYRCGVDGVVNKNLEEAFMWYRRAAGDAVNGLPWCNIDVRLKALKLLHELYLRGDCPEGEPQAIKAHYYLKKAAELRDPEAQKDLGLMYLTGETGIPQNLGKANKWLQRAATNGNEPAQKTLKHLDQENVQIPFKDAGVGDCKATIISGMKQRMDIFNMELKNEEIHPFQITNSPIFNENTFRQYPNSPTAQRFLKAYLLVCEGLEKLTRSNFTDTEGITLLARGVLYENSITQPFHGLLIFHRDSLLTLILSEQRKNPHFFEASVLLIFTLMPAVQKVGPESNKLDFREVMAFHNLIKLIKKAEPDKPPKEDPYNYEDDYSSWLHVLYYFLASVCIISDCYRDGAVAFQNALWCCPNYYEAKIGLAYCLMKMSLRKNELSADEKLLKSFDLPNSQRIPKGDFLDWTKEQQIKKAEELFLEYLEEAPECDKKYPDCHYELALLYLNKGDIEECIKWKEKGEDSEEKRLPFMEPVGAGSKKALAFLDSLPTKVLKKEKLSNNKKKCNNKNCDKEGDDVTKICPCHKVAYCGSECQKVDWKEHKKICGWKKQKGKPKKNK